MGLDDPFEGLAAPARTAPPEHITFHEDLVQGSEEWLGVRRGMLTASEMHLIVTPTLKAASNDKERAHLWELLAQRISGYVEPLGMSDDMLRGHEDEEEAVKLYSEHVAPVSLMGFVINRRWGFPIGYSPDGLVGDDGLVECKSRRQKFQVQTLVEHVTLGRGLTIPADFVIQCQTGLLVSERRWLDFLSYSGGLPMPVIRVHPDLVVQEAIVEAAKSFEARVDARLAQFRQAASADVRLIPTERIDHTPLHMLQGDDDE